MNKTLPLAGVFKVPSKARTSRPQNRERHCDGTCQQGEGDCDWDSECLPGLKCKFDWWFGTDVCTAGKGFSHVDVFENENFDDIIDYGQGQRPRTSLGPIGESGASAWAIGVGAERSA